ncbi:MAG: hypothetical protein AB7H97_00625 [Pseudobdellovibrionaceae bacterium]
MKQVAYLVPAPDMDERSINAFQFDDWDIVPLSLAPIERHTDLQSYIRSLSAQIHRPRPILIGACYGGPLAIELSKVIEAEKVIVIACVKSRQELTLFWKILFHVYQPLPHWVEKWIGVSLAFVINKILRIPVKVPRIWRKSEQNRFIAKHLLHLEGNPNIKRLIHIHGKRDRTFPIKTIKNVDIVVEANHFMIDTNRRDTLNAVAAALKSERMS